MHLKEQLIQLNWLGSLSSSPFMESKKRINIVVIVVIFMQL